MVNIAVVGCGYWGPNLIRNFITCPDASLLWACDRDEKRLSQVMSQYPGVKKAGDINSFLRDKNVDAVAVATPVNTHYPIAKACLESGKHVLLEKPLASSVQQGEELVLLARKKGLQLMIDHTFCYTGVVHKMKEFIDSGVLGELLYFDSVRINLGLFQQDINVVWDLAPHDLSILDFLIGEEPTSVSAQGVCHAGNSLENIAYVTLGYGTSFISHLHLNWLSPVKIRKTIIGGSEKMLVWNDLEPAEKLKIYDKGITIEQEDQDKRSQMLISYRSGDIYTPHFHQTEALSLMVKEFTACISENRRALTDGEAGLRVLRILEATEKSLKTNGVSVKL